MRVLSVSFLILISTNTSAQSIELMPGVERTFVDVQWLRMLGDGSEWSLFSRSRATVDYEENTNLFIGNYLNYTLPTGFGATLVGRISSLEAGGDIGLHWIKTNDLLTIFALGSVEISKEVGFSWFSILRFTPILTERWNAYFGLELFSNFKNGSHVASVQRFRLGLALNELQFGLGLNLSGLGRSYDQTDANPGIFIRKQF